MPAKTLRYYRDKYVRNLPTTFCPGCGNGTILNAFVRAVDDLGLDQKKILCASGIGCSAWIPSPHFRGDTLHTTHGRAIAFATGAKVFNSELETVVFTGDGDGAGIGGNHLIHAARRNIDIATILVNNMNYGMTGGQIAPTTIHGVYTETSPYGNPENPFDLVKLAAGAGATYVARWTTYHVAELTRSIREAIEHRGFAFIEVLSQCPTQQRRMFRMTGPMQGIPVRILEMFSESTYVRGRTGREDYFYAVPADSMEEALRAVKEELKGLKAEAKPVDHMAFGRVIRVDPGDQKTRARIEGAKAVDRTVGPREGKIELGVFVREEKPEFTESLRRVIAESRGG